ncbi:RbsD/FucU domain-containing protein [Saccharopolyspora sp. ASAGF58]|uniref:RbsD/FucU domain-containing protein n=1 Tax=Saccharopolyspora sp. ASAGF58 TaxID=2719023 RepID=UPI00143FC1CC|nr:RbsD/FucU domain-containing protein [Saccharopolyspora sp. ASAGF58]QIZ37797.1 D-ribose pyranase [Saccharopolyspora sp. ASAGF58]
MNSPKPRILNGRLAAVIAELRHGEMIFIADAGSATSKQSLTPMSDDVEQLDLSFVPGSPSVADVLPVIWEAGDFESIIVTQEMAAANPDGRRLVVTVAGEENVHEIPYKWDFYRLRDRAKLFVRTGDYAVHGNVVLVGGYSSGVIDVDRLVPKSQ